MSWTTPKTDWDTDDAIGTTDLNRIEENTSVLRTDTQGLLAREGKRPEGANQRMGVADITITETTNTGEVTISNTSITANTRIFLSIQSISGSHIEAATSMYCRVSEKTASTSFKIKGGIEPVSGGTYSDTMTVAYLLIEPQ
jgi:hypothetical protein